MDRDTLLIERISPEVERLFNEGKDTETITIELSRAGWTLCHGDVANALARVRDAAFLPAVAA